MSLTKLFWSGLFFLLFSIPTLQAQTTKPNPANFDRFIAAVYTGSGAEYIKPDTRRYSYMKSLFEERIVYVKNDKAKLDMDTGLALLSEVPLYSDYNKGLMREASFDPQRFNPFKYKFDFYSADKLIYRIDGTEYLIIIYPQDRIKN